MSLGEYTPDLGFTTSSRRDKQMNAKVEITAYEMLGEIAKDEGCTRADLIRYGLELVITEKALGTASVRARAMGALDQGNKYYLLVSDVRTAAKSWLQKLDEGIRADDTPYVEQTRLLLAGLQDTGYLDPELRQQVDNALHT